MMKKVRTYFFCRDQLLYELVPYELIILPYNIIPYLRVDNWETPFLRDPFFPDYLEVATAVVVSVWFKLLPVHQYSVNP